MAALRHVYDPPLSRRPGRSLAVADRQEQPRIPLHISVVPADDGDVVVLVGEVDIATAPRLRSTIDQLLNAGRNRIIVDLAAVTFLDAAAIDALITATCAAALAGGKLHITHHPGFMRLLKFTCETHRVNVALSLQPPITSQ